MSTGVLDIVNSALARLGESPIESMDETSAAAIATRTFYNQARQSVLRDFLWNFALTPFTPLARITSTPVDFSFAYKLPADCLRAVRLYGDPLPRGPKFLIRQGELYTDEPAAMLEYIADEEDVSKFDAMFVDALSYRLASDLAMPIKGSGELMKSYLNAYTALLEQAAATNSTEAEPALPENPYLEARW